MAVNLHTSHYRFGIEQLLEATHGWHAALDTSPAQGVIAVDTTFLLRFTVQNTGTTAASNTDQQFQYRRNGGTWTNITTSSAVVKAVASVAFTNGQACTKRLTGTGTFESSGAGCTEDGLSGGAANDIAASGNSETECALQIIGAGVGGGDSIEFRLTSPDWAITNDVVPTLVIASQPLELIGAAAGAASITAELKANRALIGQASASTQAAAFLSTLSALVGSSSGAAQNMGGLSAYRMLLGGADGSSQVYADLAALRVLFGASSGTAQAHAALEAYRGLIGGSVGQSQAFSALSSARALAGASAGSGSTSGLLGAIRVLAGASSGNAVAIALLSLVTGGGTIIEFAGFANGQGTADGALSVLLPLAGHSDGQSNASASLVHLLALRGGAAGATLTAAELSALQAFLGSSLGQATIIALLDLRDVAGLLVAASPIETTVDTWTAQTWAVEPSNTLTWVVTPGETAAYVEAVTEYVSEIVQ